MSATGKKLKRQLLKRCPSPIRNSIIRHQLNLNYELPEGVEFRIAATQSEYEQAFHLLYNSYVEVGLQRPNESEMRVSIYNALLTSYVLIAAVADRVIGTVSIIRDSSIGLPSEKVLDLTEIRRPGRQLAEVSAFAIVPEWRGKISFPLMKYMTEIAFQCMGIDCLVVTAHSDWYMFYEAVFGFRPIVNKVIDNYAFANFIPVVGMYIVDFPSVARKLYSRTKRPAKNIAHYFNDHRFEQFKKPILNYYSILNTSMNHSLIQYFCRDRFDLAKGLPLSDYRKITGIHRDMRLFDVLSTPEEIKNVVLFERTRSWRIPTFLRAGLPDGTLLRITNVSADGFQVSGSPLELIEREVYELTLHLGPENRTKLRTRVIWRNQDNFGMKVEDKTPEWNTYISFCLKQLELVGSQQQPMEQESRAA